jgi:hypothetical protein
LHWRRPQPAWTVLVFRFGPAVLCLFSTSSAWSVVLALDCKGAA